MDKDDGGAAFPTRPDDFGAPDIPGMSLRDWFAGQALAGVLQDRVSVQGIWDQSRNEDISVGQVIARSMYDIADAMLAEIKGAK